MNKPGLLFISLALAMLLTACGSTPTQTRYYVLHPDTGASALGSASEQSIGIGPVILPESLQQSGITTLDEQNVIAVAHNHLWAGDLKQAISQVMAQNIGRLLDSPRVWPYPWDARSRPEWQAKIVVQQLSGQRGGEITLQVKWQLFNQQGSQPVAVEQASFSDKAQGNGYNDYVAAINRLINQCSQAVARSLAQHIAGGQA